MMTNNALLSHDTNQNNLSIELVTNAGQKDHLQTIGALINQSEEVNIAVSFIKKSGLQNLMDILRAGLEIGKKFKIYCGLDLFLTEPDALRDLHDLFDEYPGNTIRIINKFEIGIFHPKIYYFKFENERNEILLGSANLTDAGLKNNVEASMLINLSSNSEISQKFDAFFKFCENNSEIANIWRISQYQRKYEIFHKHKNIAEIETKNEFRNIKLLDENKILQELEKYLEDTKQQADFEYRTRNYDKARSVLEDLMDDQQLSDNEFLNKLELLVGKSGHGHLWHSDKLYRHKNKIVRKYQLFIEMLKILKDNIDQPVESVFGLGKSYTEQIPGLGFNILTEILNTFTPNRFAVLNKRPLNSLKYFGFEEFPYQGSFTAEDYKRYVDLLSYIKSLCEFSDLGRVDHFLNYIYEKQVMNK